MILLLILSIITPLVICLINFRQGFTLLWFYPAAGFFFDVLGTALKLFGHLDNKWLANAFVLTEFLLVSFYFRQQFFPRSRWSFGFILLIAGLFIAHATHNSLLDFDTIGYSIFCLFYIAYGLAGFFVLMQKQKELFLWRSSFFWSNTAVFLYASSVFLLFLFRYYLQEKDRDIFNTLWQTFFLVINTQRYILIGIALRKQKKA